MNSQNYLGIEAEHQPNLAETASLLPMGKKLGTSMDLEQSLYGLKDYFIQ